MFSGYSQARFGCYCPRAGDLRQIPFVDIEIDTHQPVVTVELDGESWPAQSGGAVSVLERDDFKLSRVGIPKSGEIGFNLLAGQGGQHG